MPVGRILLMSEKMELASDDPTSSVLRNAGYEVLKISFFNGSLDPPDKNEGIHAVLIDLTKAVIDGDGMLDEVEKRYPDAPVAVLISDRNSPMVLPKLRQSAYEFLPKPFQSEQLLAMVARAIEHRNLKCEIRNLGREMTAIQRRAESEAQDKLEKMRHCLGDLELSFDLALEVCCEAIDQKEYRLHGHSKRVTAYTIAIAPSDAVGQRIYPSDCPRCFFT
jgi:DNA-binding NtrC family response regulator